MYENENLEEFKNDMVEDFEVRKQVVSKITNDFTKKGINEERYLIELTTFVLYEIVTQKRVNYKKLEQRAIDYYAKGNIEFFNSYRNLVTDPKYYDGDDSLEDDYSDENAYII